MKFRLLAFVLCIFTAHVLTAQLRPGVRIGLNISQIKGPSEKGPNGTNLEKVSNLTGFLIGPSFAYPFTDNFGLRGEVLYSRKGGKYEYKGPVTRSFIQDGSSVIVNTSGEKSANLIITHNTLDLPIMAYARLGRVEISGGFYASLLFGKVADGEETYEWTNQDNSPGKIVNTLSYNYNRDKFGEGDDSKSEIAYFNSAQTRKSTIPKTLGAYYNYSEDRGNLFRTLDYGAAVGASVFLSSSLFVGGRLQYGLADLTRNDADQSRYERDDNNFLLFRNDKDINYNIQVYVGFSLR
jgi:hypothetical protein